MRWRGRRRSSNVEDRRRVSRTGIAVGGGGGAILIALVIMLLGGDPSGVVNQLPVNTGSSLPGDQGTGASPEQDELDVEEALRAASAIGDDTIQKRSRGYVVPDSFTHGSSEQRVRWFRKGLETGDLSQGDTFATSRL